MSVTFNQALKNHIQSHLKRARIHPTHHVFSGTELLSKLEAHYNVKASDTTWRPTRLGANLYRGGIYQTVAIRHGGVELLVYCSNDNPAFCIQENY